MPQDPDKRGPDKRGLTVVQLDLPVASVVWSKPVFCVRFVLFLLISQIPVDHTVSNLIQCCMPTVLSVVYANCTCRLPKNVAPKNKQAGISPSTAYQCMHTNSTVHRL